MVPQWQPASSFSPTLPAYTLMVVKGKQGWPGHSPPSTIPLGKEQSWKEGVGKTLKERKCKEEIVLFPVAPTRITLTLTLTLHASSVLLRQLLHPKKLLVLQVDEATCEELKGLLQYNVPFYRGNIMKMKR